MVAVVNLHEPDAIANGAVLIDPERGGEIRSS